MAMKEMSSKEQHETAPVVDQPVRRLVDEQTVEARVTSAFGSAAETALVRAIEQDVIPRLQALYDRNVGTDNEVAVRDYIIPTGFVYVDNGQVVVDRESIRQFLDNLSPEVSRVTNNAMRLMTQGQRVSTEEIRVPIPQLDLSDLGLDVNRTIIRRNAERVFLGSTRILLNALATHLRSNLTIPTSGNESVEYGDVNVPRGRLPIAVGVLEERESTSLVIGVPSWIIPPGVDLGDASLRGQVPRRATED